MVNHTKGVTLEKISTKEKISYGLGDVATAFSAVTVASFSMFYFTEVIGVSAGFLGTALFFTRIFDAITNIIMGHIVDNTNTKHGKARPWILRTIVPMALALVLVFIVPSNWSSKAQAIYIVITYNIYYLVYTASNIPYGTLGTLISRDPQVRSELNIFRMIGYFSISTILSYVTYPLVAKFGGGPKGWITAVSIYALIMSALFMIVFKNTKERIHGDEEKIKDSEEKLSFFASMRLLFKNKYWILIFSIMVFAWMLVNLFGGVNIYYAEHMLGDVKYVGLLNGLYNGAQLLGFFLVGSIIKRFGRRRSIVTGQIVIILSSLACALYPTSIGVVATASILRGLGFSPLMGTAYAMLADTIDYGEWKNGIRNEGMTYSGGTFSTTFGSGVASAGIGWVLSVGGYLSGGVKQQPASVYKAIQFLFAYAPMIVAVLIIVMFYFYNLDTIYPKIMSDLKRDN